MTTITNIENENNFDAEYEAALEAQAEAYENEKYAMEVLIEDTMHHYM